MVSTDENLQNDLLFHKNQGVTDQFKHIHFALEQVSPINKYMLNMYRVFSSDERAPGKLGVAAKAMKAKKAPSRIENDGMLYYESEVIACFNMMSACRNVMNSKTSIKEDIRSINLIQKDDPNYFSSDKKRRQIMGLKVAISNKQTVQVSAKAINERAVDMIHRKVLHELMPSISKDSKYQMVDFDVLYGALVHDLKWLS